MSKNNLNDLLDSKPPRIKKPRGLTISTDLEERTESTNAPVHKDISAPVHKSTNTEMHKDTSALGHENSGAAKQESTNALMPESTNALEHKDTGAPVQESTNAEMHKDTNALEHKNSDAAERESTGALVQESTNAPVKDPRPSKGYKIRTDIADACKLLAVQRKRKMYEVMEEGLLIYLRQQGVDIS